MNGFRGGFGGGMQMQQLMKQAQKMQEDMLKKQEELENSVVNASVSGGMVQIEMTGKKEIKSIKINPAIVDSNDVEMLEDLIVAAFNEASSKVDTLKKETMGDMGGLPF